jgi:hypothetical protein
LLDYDYNDRVLNPSELVVKYFGLSTVRARSGARQINPETLKVHPKIMLVHRIAFAVFLSCSAVAYTGCSACSNKPNNADQLRQQTAEATAQLKDNAKAVAQGIRDGLTRPSADHPLDINSASKSQLMSLPGMDDATADRIIGGRPYTSEHELMEKRIVSREEYNKIADSITVKK